MASFTFPSMSEIVNKNPALFSLGLIAATIEKRFGRRRLNTLERGACSSAEGSMVKAAGRPSTSVTPSGRALTSRAFSKSLVPASKENSWWLKLFALVPSAQNWVSLSFWGKKPKNTSSEHPHLDNLLHHSFNFTCFYSRSCYTASVLLVGPRIPQPSSWCSSCVAFVFLRHRKWSMLTTGSMVSNLIKLKNQ